MKLKSTPNTPAAAQSCDKLSRRSFIQLAATAVLAASAIGSVGRAAYNHKHPLRAYTGSFVLPKEMAKAASDLWNGKCTPITDKKLLLAINAFDNDQRDSLLAQIKNGEEGDGSSADELLWRLVLRLENMGYSGIGQSNPDADPVDSLSALFARHGLEIRPTILFRPDGKRQCAYLFSRALTQDFSLQIAGKKISCPLTMYCENLTLKSAEVLRSNSFVGDAGNFDPSGPAIMLDAEGMLDQWKKALGKRSNQKEDKFEKKAEEDPYFPFLREYSRRGNGLSSLCRFTLDHLPELQGTSCDFESAFLSNLNAVLLHESFHFCLHEGRNNEYFAVNEAEGEFCAEMGTLASATNPFDTLSSMVEYLILDRKTGFALKSTALMVFQRLAEAARENSHLLSADFPRNLSTSKVDERMLNYFLKLSDEEVRFLATDVLNNEIIPFSEGKIAHL